MIILLNYVISVIKVLIPLAQEEEAAAMAVAEAAAMVGVEVAMEVVVTMVVADTVAVSANFFSLSTYLDGGPFVCVGGGGYQGGKAVLISIACQR